TFPDEIAEALLASAFSDYSLDERRDSIRSLQRIGMGERGRDRLLPDLFQNQFPSALASEITALCEDDLAGFDALVNHLEGLQLVNHRERLRLADSYEVDVITAADGFLERALHALRSIDKHLQHPATPGLDAARGARAVA